MTFLEKILVYTFHLLPQIVAWLEIDRPDCVVYENTCLWARAAVHKLHIPAVCFFTSYITSPHERNAGYGSSTIEEGVRADLRRLCDEYDLPLIEPEAVTSHTELLNIAFFPRAFQPGGETFGERFEFVGPSITIQRHHTDFPWHQLDPQRMLYISLGTIFNYRADFFNLCFAALKDLPWQVVLSYGTRLDLASLDPVPQNFLVAPYVPQLEVLSYAQVFVTHGGMNSVMESFYYGVPMVIVPQIPEQASTARRVQELGLGLALSPRELNGQTLRDSVMHVAQDRTHHERLQEMRHIAHDAGGYKKAADVLMRFSKQH